MALGSENQMGPKNVVEHVHCSLFKPETFGLPSLVFLFQVSPRLENCQSRKRPSCGTQCLKTQQCTQRARRMSRRRVRSTRYVSSKSNSKGRRLEQWLEARTFCTGD